MKKPKDKTPQQIKGEEDLLLDWLKTQKTSLPYPWCRHPEICIGKGYCPRDPNCGE